jgi:chemotaxis protein methyltransferase CheR
LGGGQWNIPRLRQLLEEILPKDSHFRDFEVEQHFPSIGPKKMLLNARRLNFEKDNQQMILLAIEDVTPATIVK